ncbi:MAG: putative toxin-antitoxin system toxin component, PIN family [Acidiferrobacterales bacterium]|nr:PIN domain-containing protein [Gammaproteobacteria bacterium]
MRVFPDTGVLVAALATRGLCADLLRLVLVEHQLVTGRPVFRELRRVLVEQLRLPQATADQVMPFLREQGEISAPAQPAPWPVDDADDRWILAAALEVGTDVLVTSDPALLAIEDRVPFRICRPRGFWELLRGR